LEKEWALSIHAEIPAEKDQSSTTAFCFPLNVGGESRRRNALAIHSLLEDGADDRIAPRLGSPDDHGAQNRGVCRLAEAIAGLGVERRIRPARNRW
jgi:hypothetical protein